METLITRSDGREDGEEWTENYERLPGGAGISIILESTTKEERRAAAAPASLRGDVHHPPRLGDLHRRCRAGRAPHHRPRGQVLVVPAHTPHRFRTGPEGYEAVHIHANDEFVTEWLE